MGFNRIFYLVSGLLLRSLLAAVRPSNLPNRPSLRSASWRFLNTHRAQVKTCHEIRDFGLGLQHAPTMHMAWMSFVGAHPCNKKSGLFVCPDFYSPCLFNISSAVPWMVILGSSSSAASQYNPFRFSQRASRASIPPAERGLPFCANSSKGLLIQ